MQEGARPRLVPGRVPFVGAGGPVSLSRVVRVDRATRWFFPEAPLTVDIGMGAAGRAWWQIDIERLISVAIDCSIG